MRITEIVALVSAIAFILNVVFVCGFSKPIDVNLFRYFSINDYFTLTLTWMIPSSIYFLFGVATGILLLSAEKSVPIEKGVKLLPKSNFKKILIKYFMGTSNFQRSSIYIVPAIILTILSFFLTVPKAILFFIYLNVAVFLWPGLISLYIDKSEFGEGWIVKYRATITLVPICCLAVFFYGHLSGDWELAEIDKHPTERLEMTIEAPNKKGRILFALSQYIVFLEQKTKMVEIIPVSQVKNIIPIPKEKSKEKKNKKQLEDS